MSSDYVKALTARRETIYNEAEKLLAAVTARGDGFNESEDKRWTEIESELSRLDRSIAAAGGTSLDSRKGDPDPQLRFNTPMSVAELRKFGRQQDGIGGEELYADERILRNLGLVFKAAYYRSAEFMPAEYRALNTAVGANGSYLVPSSISSELVAYAFNRTAVLQAGARTVPMSTQSVIVPRVSGVPQGAFYGEGDTIAAEDVTVSGVSLEARRLSTLVKASIEIVHDSAFAVGELVISNIARAFAVAVDQAVLQGTGGKNTLTGVKNWAGVTTTSVGAALTNYDVLVNSANAVRLKNYGYDDLAQIMFQDDLATLATLKDTQNRYLDPPKFLDSIPRYATTNLTKTAGKTDLYSGDWDLLWIGILLNQLTFQLNEKYADTGQLGFVAHMRLDSAIVDSAAFDVRTTIG